MINIFHYLFFFYSMNSMVPIFQNRFFYGFHCIIFWITILINRLDTFSVPPNKPYRMILFLILYEKQNHSLILSVDQNFQLKLIHCLQYVKVECINPQKIHTLHPVIFFLGLHLIDANLNRYPWSFEVII